MDMITQYATRTMHYISRITHTQRLLTLSLVVVFGSLSFCQPSIGSTIELVLLKEVEIDNEMVYLGDITAEINGVTDASQRQALQSLKLKRAPLSGRPPITIDAVTIGTYLRSARSVLRKMALEPNQFKVDPSARVVVKRKVSHISVESLIQFAADFLREGLNQRFEADYEIEAQTPISDFDLPHGVVRFSPRPLRDRFLTGDISAYVDILINEQKSKTVVLPFSVTLTMDVLVSQKAIGRHDPITIDDVNVEQRTLNRLRVPPLLLDELQNVRANRGISKGTLLTKELVQPIPKILSGSIVPIHVNLNGVSVITRGVVLSDGYVGQKINVINQRSRKKLAGIVTPEGAVQIIVLH